jgi:Na+-translocating ferredoxin:NAD+ oxidoreductase RnfC subunit
LQEVQGGFMCERGVFLGGFMEGCQDLDLDLGITKVCWGLCAKRQPHLLPLLDPETG